jgi:predicted DsbA family dithiol-disulfide isomerase
MRVQLWFDPVCPFCWMTSRWLVRVAPERDLAVEWLPISLLMKNELAPGERFFEECTASHGMLRVIESVREAGHDEQVGAIYTELGRHLHVRRDQPDLPAILAALDLDVAHAEAADDVRFDAAIRAAMDDGLALVGDDVGTPIIALTRADGVRVGLFGPVITDLPDLDASLRLWDGFVAMVETDGFFELKRTRTAQPARLSESDL